MRIEIPFNVSAPAWQKICTEHDAQTLQAFVNRLKIDWRGRRLTEEKVLALWTEFKSETTKQS